MSERAGGTRRKYLDPNFLTTVFTDRVFHEDGSKEGFVVDGFVG